MPFARRSGVRPGRRCAVAVDRIDRFRAVPLRSRKAVRRSLKRSLAGSRKGSAVNESRVNWARGGARLVQSYNRRVRSRRFAVALVALAGVVALSLGAEGAPSTSAPDGG